MNVITITLPEWMLWLLVCLCILSLLDAGLRWYVFELRRKLKILRAGQAAIQQPSQGGE